METQSLSFLQKVRIILRMIMSLFARAKPPATATWSSSSDVAVLPNLSGPRPKLEDLKRVIAIGQVQSAADLDVMILSLESYGDGFLVLGRHSNKYGDLSPDNLWHAMPAFSAVDDLDNAYRWMPTGGNRNRFECAFTPALNSLARQLTMTVTQVRWTFLRENRQQIDEGPWIFTVPLK